MKTAKSLADAASITRSDILDLEGAYVRTVEAATRENRQGVFHPSAVGSCGRKNVYEYIRAPMTEVPVLGADDLEIFTMGHAVHEIVQTKLRGLTDPVVQYEFQEEVGFDPNTDQLYEHFGIGGTTDGVLRAWVPEEWEQRGIVEIKSIKDKHYEALREPKEDHVMQAHLYAFRFDCPIIWIWYYNKNTSHRKVYTLVYDHDILVAALKRYEGWMAHVSAGTLPDREESWWSCPRCAYKEICNPSVVRKLAGTQRASSNPRRKTRLHRSTR